MRKPKVFLSHSKRDKAIVERLANDLRRARIDVWYDEWEIPPGEPFRKKIFEDGIPNCDLFFVYLTQSSKESFWVTRELDAAYVHEINQRGSFMGIFVDSDETRRSLPLDIQALHSPVLNNDDDIYFSSLISLIARIWESTAMALVREFKDKQEKNTLRLENTVLELQNQMLQKDIVASARSSAEVISVLERKLFTFNIIQRNLKEIFESTANRLATGINYSQFVHFLKPLYRYDSDNNVFKEPQIDATAILGELILLNLVSISPATEQYSERYFLSEFGKEVTLSLRETK
ncbi:toll/interleukin-1 receptor domain-containing protein [Paenibacillus taichungensis]|uniref:toll/interleukin-1 receptor domain-containing protein n=1 Tax=Paenibacillus taichungensis TaxID=484184 RepID=UPI002872418C|nr:toll/interleukin-1 receptor domain-containing protein [Paenibacillus taichungensis]MDR9748802.1 toll/interleukin-1 receptor domain-containing protein [Paenibacillus taichungensis]